MSNQVNFKLLELVSKTNDLVGASFITINGYVSTKNEVANHKVNLNASIENAKAKDLKEFKELDIVKYYNSIKENLNSKFTLELFQKAYVNVYNSLVKVGDKNYDNTIKVASSQRKAQLDAYEYLNGSIKWHYDLQRLYIYGLCESKEVLEEGVYPTVNSRPLTIAQNMLKKGMKHKKFRMYVLEGVDSLNGFKQHFKGIDLQ